MAVDTEQVSVRVLADHELRSDHEDWKRILSQSSSHAVGADPRWVPALSEGLRHRPIVLAATHGSCLAGVLPLILVKSALFGRFLVSLPYVNSSGVVALDNVVAQSLVDEAIRLSNECDVNYLELRHEIELEHGGLTEKNCSKLHMRLALPGTANELMGQFQSKLRSQIRSSEKKGLTVAWGGIELLPNFYSVFSRNMRDLGTPVFGRSLFRAILTHFGNDAEFCVVRSETKAIAAGLVVHGIGITEVPSASSLREFNSTGANMLMYWHLLQRAIERGQRVFDFGRSDKDGPHYKFKEQWGAKPYPATWQYHVRRGSPSDMRRQSAKYSFLIRSWQKLPLRVANAMGPSIVRGIP